MATSYADICDVSPNEYDLKKVLCKQSEPYVWVDPEGYELEELQEIVDCVHNIDNLVNHAYNRGPVTCNSNLEIVKDLETLDIPWDNLYYSEIEMICDIYDKLKNIIQN